MDDNTLDLLEIFNFLKSHVIKMIVSGIIFLILSFIYILNFPVFHSSSLSFSELSERNQALGFSNLNYSLEEYFKKNNRIQDAPSINANSLAINFSEIIRDPKTIKLTLEDIGIEPNPENVEKYSKNTSLRFIRKQNQYSKNFIFSVQTENQIDSEKYIESTFKIASLLTIEKVKSTIEVLLEKLEYEKKLSIDLLQKQIEIELLTGIEKVNNRITYLKEQAALARILQISKPAFNPPLEINIEGNNDKGFIQKYLEGYEAIEAEIKILQERDDHGAFIPNIDKLEKQIANINAYNELALLSYYYEKINSKDLPVTYNLKDIKTEKTKSRTIIHSLAFIFGFAFLFVYYTYYKIYFKK